MITGPATMEVRRNVLILALAQGLFMSVQGMGISATPLAAHGLLGADKSLATLPIFLNHMGVMLTTVPASLLMARLGRRAGFSIGALLGVVFGILAAIGIWKASFEILCVAAVLQGSAAAFAWYYRFAAADASPPASRPRRSPTSWREASSPASRARSLPNGRLTGSRH